MEDRPSKRFKSDGTVNIGESENRRGIPLSNTLVNGEANNAEFISLDGEEKEDGNKTEVSDKQLVSVPVSYLKLQALEKSDHAQ